LNNDNTIRAKLKVADSITATGITLRDQVENVTIECVGTTLIAKAYVDEPQSTLQTAANVITNTGVYVTLVNHAPLTSVRVATGDDESTTPTTTVTTSATSTTATSTSTTTPTTTITTSQTTTPIHGRLECLRVGGSSEYITMDRDKCPQQLALLTGAMQGCYDGNTVFPTLNCVSVDGTANGARILHSNSCDPHGLTLLNRMIREFAFPASVTGE
jgi:hypothetical protein